MTIHKLFTEEQLREAEEKAAEMRLEHLALLEAVEDAKEELRSAVAGLDDFEDYWEI